MGLGEKIREFRLKKGITHQQLADAIGVKRAAVSKYEKDAVNISIKQLEKIAKTLDISVEDLIFEKDDEIGKSNYKRIISENPEFLDGSIYSFNSHKTNDYEDKLDKLFDNIKKGVYTDEEMKKIARILQTPAEQEIDIKIPEDNVQRTPELNELIERYNSLNTLGQQKANEYITDLSEQEKYTKPDNED